MTRRGGLYAANEAAGLRFMVGEATDDDLLAATALNHIDWMQRLGRGSNGVVAFEDGVHWTSVARTRREVTAAVTEQPGLRVRDHLDRMLAVARVERVDRIGYWAFLTEYASRLGPWLGARGFRWGGKPHWMSLDLSAMTALPSLSELSGETNMAVAHDLEPIEDTLLPCFDPDTAHVRAAMAAERPRRVWHIVQREGGQPIGQISLDMTSGDLGVCGLHDTVVVPDKRVSGVGAKRLQWVCRFALDLGCRYLVTNAAEGNGPLFRVWGFRSLGFGQTWWLPGPTLQAPPPETEVRFAEAIGTADLDTLESLYRREQVPDLDKTLAAGMTPLRFAAATASPVAARWLLDKGATPDLLAAWDLGWRAEAEQLAQRPEVLRQRRPRSGKTLLHLAVERDDEALAELLLAAGIDVSCTDERWGSTALELARRHRRVGPASAILRHQAGARRRAVSGSLD